VIRLLTAALLAVLVLAAPAEAGVRPFDISAKVTMQPGGGASLLQTGAFRGTIGHGSVRVRTFVGQGRGSVVRFTLRTARGTVSGTGDCAVRFKGAEVLYDGTAKITGGTGDYAGITGRNLKVSGRGELSAERFSVRVTGRVRL
jgi:hypothetical protein